MADNRPLALQRDPYGEKILLGKFDWRDERMIQYIRDFIRFGRIDSKANIRRQKAIHTGRLLRSVAWKTWSESGGDVQVFHAHYQYYSKFVELALGRDNPYIGLPPTIPGIKWGPIQMPDGRRRRAKPSIPTEMRKRARKFTTFALDSFSWSGIAMLVYSMRTNNVHSAQINRALFAHGLHGANNNAVFK